MSNVNGQAEAQAKLERLREAARAVVHARSMRPGGGDTVPLLLAIDSLETALAQPEAREPRGYIDVVFDGPPGPESGRFVEVEDATGKSIRFGEWVERADGYWVLRFMPSALAQPPDGGEVVERAVTVIDNVLYPHMEAGEPASREAVNVACALHAAGLLAGPMDRERLARALHASFGGSSTEWERGLNEKHRDSWRHTADAILREVGR